MRLSRRPSGRTWGAAAPAALVLAALGAAALAPTASAVTPTNPYPRWSEVADGPLKAREHATAVWTGKEVLVFGGDTYPCAPNAKCAAPTDPPLSDGAAYDPRTDTWRRIAKAPLPVPRASTAVVGRYVYALIDPDYNLKTFAPQHQTFARYDVVKNAWKVFDRPPSEFANLTLAAVGGKVVAYYSPKDKTTDRDFVWDAGDRAWRRLPADPKGPFDARVMVDVDGAAVVLGTDLNTAGAAGESAPTMAARLDLGTKTWQHYKKSGIAADAPFWWSAGGRAVNATDGKSGGLSLGGAFDPSTGTWSKLPARPALSGAKTETFDWAQAGGGDTVVAGRYAYDAAARKWRVISAYPALRGYLQGPSVVWAGDRLFVWGGAMFPDGGGPRGLRDAGYAWTAQLSH